MSILLELRRRAAEVAIPRTLTASAKCATVGAALETRMGDIFVGVCIDTRSSLGFCAEHAAAAAMLTAGQHEIKRVVAVSHRGDVLAPCGRCREFLSQLADSNLEALIMVNETETATLRELLPHRWSPPD